jgi:hypothetical protein
MIGNRHPLLAHAVGEKHIAVIGARVTVGREIAAEGVDIDTAAFLAAGCEIGLSQFALVDREPPLIEVF